MKVCILGLGRIGLPLALVCADCGYEIIGIDKNEKLINNLKNGVVPFYEHLLEGLLCKYLQKSFFPRYFDVKETEKDLKECHYLIMTVGTSLDKNSYEPDLADLYSLIDDLIKISLIGKHLILRATVPVGTTDKIREHIETNTGLKESIDFFLSFVPERLIEGQAIKEEKALPKIIGSYTEQGFLEVKQFFERVGGETIRVSNPKVAEFVKLLDNSWRDTLFAFANDAALLAGCNGIDAIEAISCANKGYPRNKIPSPGPVSGYCLSKDPYILEDSFQKLSQKRELQSVWYYGRKANEWLCEYISEQVEGENVLVAGLSFKEDIDDYRESHAVKIVSRLIDKGYRVKVSDPYLDKNDYTRLPPELEGQVEKYNSVEEAIGNLDTIVFTTKHAEYVEMDLPKILNSNKKTKIKIIDLWNIYRGGFEGVDHITYVGLGRGDLNE